MHDKKLQEECIQYIGKKGRTPPSFRDVFMLYCGLSPGATVKDLCTRYSPSNLRVDERRLIQFGMVTGIIRRLHKYPVQLTAPSKSTSLSRSHLRFRGKQADTNRLKLSDKWLDGNHNYDEICCKTGLTYQELEDIVEGEPHIVVIWKWQEFPKLRAFVRILLELSMSHVNKPRPIKCRVWGWVITCN